MRSAAPSGRSCRPDERSAAAWLGVGLGWQFGFGFRSGQGSGSE